MTLTMRHRRHFMCRLRSKCDQCSWLGTHAKLRPFTSGTEVRKHQPPTLIVWGKNDIIFPPSGAHPYLRDLPKAELHLLDTGHFALEDKHAEIAALMGDFLGRNLTR